MLGEAAAFAGFALLGLIGLLMLHKSVKGGVEEKFDGTSGIGLIMIALSISLDSLGVGIALPAAHIPLVPLLITVSITTTIFTLIGLAFGARLGARYERSLDMLAYAKQTRPAVPTKSGLMLGLGETGDEVRQVMRDLRAHQVDILTIGQYLRPSQKHLPIIRYIPLEEFAEFKRFGYELGFSHVESGPLVRSSYHAADAV